VQFRILGPDLRELRTIADKVGRVMRSNPHLRNVNNDWGDLSKTVQVAVDQNKARRLGLSTQDVSTAQTLLRGAIITDYREGTDLIPVVARAVAAEREDIMDLPQIEIQSALGRTVLLSQIATIRYVLEEPTIWRRNRIPELAVPGEIAGSMQAPT
jgi:multidrug efflux pump